jgi:fructoselysine-6-P-deglycase FrlB-like protein
MSKTHGEIGSQPACWRRAAALAAKPDTQPALPSAGVEVAVVGCGTSLFIAQAYAALREASGQGRTDAFAASEFPAGRRYPLVVAISRSGTTSEVAALLATLPAGSASVLLTAVAASPCAEHAERVILLAFADEESVVQTRFATTVLPLEPGSVDQITFLGSGWTVGLAQEAALKCREAAQFWTEAYPAMEYRHGPLSIAQPGRAVWPFGSLPPGLSEQIVATGATLADTSGLEPMAALVLAQRFAAAEAERRGLDPDQPRNLTRSVVLPPGQLTP